MTSSDCLWCSYSSCFLNSWD